MGKILIVVSGYEKLCSEAMELLQSHGHELVFAEKGYASTFEDLCPLVGDIDAALIGGETWGEELFRLAPKLKIISRFGVGVDNIDLVSAKRRGIIVTNAKGGNANAVAELTVGFIIDALREVVWLHSNMKKGTWVYPMGYDLKGKTVGLLGFGDIAQRVAKMLSGFDVTILATSRHPDKEKANLLGVGLVDGTTLLAQSDILSLHIPSNADTYHYIDAKKLSLMKQGAFLINTARGALVDTAALCEALSSGHLAGAALDVFEQEPLSPDSPLLAFENILFTPHMASETYDTYIEIGQCTARAIIDVLEGSVPDHVVN